MWSGIILFNKDVLSIISKNRPVFLETEVFSTLIGMQKLRAYVTTERFFDIGTVAQKAEFEKYVLEHRL